MSTPTKHYSVAVVGAGPAGSAASIVLAKAGWKVALLDRDSFPRDKLCGEFLSGESQRLLAHLDCIDALAAHAPPLIRQMRFVSHRGAALTIPLPHPAMGISRRLLDVTLVQRAVASGVDIYASCEVQKLTPASGDATMASVQMLCKTARGSIQNELTADFVIAAYGRYSHLDRTLGRTFIERSHGHVAFKLHHRLREASSLPVELIDTGEMYGFAGGYCGICSIEGGLFNVCMLLRRDVIGDKGKWPDLIQRFSSGHLAFGKRMEGLEPLQESVQSVAQIDFKTKELAIGNICFVGDAAGMITPLCGDGQAMAIESGVRLAELIIGEFKQTNNAWSHATHASIARQWATWWKHRYRDRLWLGRGLQSLFFHPDVAHGSLRVLQLAPGFARLLARATRGA
ncbi:MAG: NAD(P)/FAD-dependent oxidoreductase [Candidatus Sumerlaeaceae bacterium]